MIHAAASIDPDGAALLVCGPRRIRCDVTTLHLDAAELAGGREHVTVWVPDLDDYLIRAQARGVSMLGGTGQPRVRLARDYAAGFHAGRVHVRSTRLLADDAPACPIDIDGAIESVRSVYERVARIPWAGSGTQAAHAVFREGARAWQTPATWTTPIADWLRSSMYGGRLVVHEAGLWHTRRHREAQRYARMRGERGASRAPTRHLDAGWELARADIARAYPWTLSHRIPYVWRPPVTGRDGTPWREYAHGVAHARVDLTEARCTPVRIPGRHGNTTAWPSRGRVTGPYTFESLRLAEECGATVEAVGCPVGDWSWVAWPRRDRYAAHAVEAFDRMADEHTGHAWGREIIKGLGRRLYGAFAAGRWTMEAHPIADLVRRGIVPRARFGDLGIIAVAAEEYPTRALAPWAAYAVARTTSEVVRAERAMRAAGGHPLYTDTDSLLAAVPAGTFPGLELGDGLGRWREDWRGGWCAIMGPRWYVLSGRNNGVRASGVPRDAAGVLWSHGRVTVTTRDTITTPARTVDYRVAWARHEELHSVRRERPHPQARGRSGSAAR